MTITADLLNWYDGVKRDLPWRREKGAYPIWVSEIMLQQTRVDTVIPYYQRFMERFPTVADLAAAEEEEVLSRWQGLGYYSRARNLHQAAREVQERYGGQVPSEEKELRSLPGLGSYTTGAVLSIAFGQGIPAVDGNVLRVISRIFALEEDIAGSKAKRSVEEQVRTLLPEDRPGDFNQGLMELGAMVCLPRNPQCSLCPVRGECLAYQTGRTQELPIKSKSKPGREEFLVYGLIRGPQGICLVQRPRQGMLGGLWEFPGGFCPEGLKPGAGLGLRLAMDWDLSVAVGPAIAQASHVFSHRTWQMELFLCSWEGQTLPEAFRQVSREELAEIPMAEAHRKLLRQVEGYLEKDSNSI